MRVVLDSLPCVGWGETPPRLRMNRRSLWPETALWGELASGWPAVMKETWIQGERGQSLNKAWSQRSTQCASEVRNFRETREKE